jgi:hypothetical protein
VAKRETTIKEDGKTDALTRGRKNGRPIGPWQKPSGSSNHVVDAQNNTTIEP